MYNVHMYNVNTRKLVQAQKAKIYVYVYRVRVCIQHHIITNKMMLLDVKHTTYKVVNVCIIAQHLICVSESRLALDTL
jgi:hypothetical protein